MGAILTGEAEGTGSGSGAAFRLRKQLNMYAKVCRIQSFEGLPSRYSNVDCVIIREQMEGEYKALEHEPVPGVVEALKITTRTNSEQICKVENSFDYSNQGGPGPGFSPQSPDLKKRTSLVQKQNIFLLFGSHSSYFLCFIKSPLLQ